MQRADLLERVLADLAGPQRLVAEGIAPAALVTGSPDYLRGVARLAPPGGYHVHVAAFDLARAPAGEWRVLADHLRAPPLGKVGAAFADALLGGLAARCRIAEPRVALLTPGRSSAEGEDHVRIAATLGLTLVERADLLTSEEGLFLRTIAGPWRIDALLSLVDPRLLDPLALDSRSQVGVAGLIDVYAAGRVVLANAPGAGLLEARAWSAFLPRLSERLAGEAPILPDLATWWCGQPGTRTAVEAKLDTLAIAPAFGPVPPALPPGGLASTPHARAALLADLARRPQDYVAREALPVGSTTLRAYAARTSSGEWFVVAEDAGDPPPASSRRTSRRQHAPPLTSRAADDLFWFGRYLARAEALLALVRALADEATDLGTAARLAGMVAAQGAAPALTGCQRRDLLQLARTALDSSEWQSVAVVVGWASRLGDRLGEHLPHEAKPLLSAPLASDPVLDAALDAASRRDAAIEGALTERTMSDSAWRFLDLGRRIERAIAGTRSALQLGLPGASADDLRVMLALIDRGDITDARHLGELARERTVERAVLDRDEPGSVACELSTIARHLAALPSPTIDAVALPNLLVEQDARSLGVEALAQVDARLSWLSEAVARRYFAPAA